MTNTTNIKFMIKGENGMVNWGVSNYLTKTPYLAGKDSRPATKQDIKAGKPTYYPRRYFAYILKDNMPILLVENRDQIEKNNTIVCSPVYYKQATIKWHKTNDKFTHHIKEDGVNREDEKPYLKVKTGPRSTHIKPNTIFHVNGKGLFISEPFDPSTAIITNGNRYPK